MLLLTKPAINAIFKRLSELDPEPKTELNYTNPYTLLVAIVLSAQMTDKGVNRATEVLFKIADTPQKMVRLGEEKLLPYLARINFHRGKAKNVIRLSQILIDRYKGRIPEHYDALIELPGVGGKTASVWLNSVLGHPLIAVDTHVFRVANRTGLCRTRSPAETQEALQKVIPKKWQTHAHHWLILHGRYICKARLPECWRCPIRQWCLYPDKVLTPPVKGKRKKIN